MMGSIGSGRPPSFKKEANFVHKMFTAHIRTSRATHKEKKKQHQQRCAQGFLGFDTEYMAKYLKHRVFVLSTQIETKRRVDS